MISLSFGAGGWCVVSGLCGPLWLRLAGFWSCRGVWLTCWTLSWSFGISWLRLVINFVCMFSTLHNGLSHCDRTWIVGNHLCFSDWLPTCRFSAFSCGLLTTFARLICFVLLSHWPRFYIKFKTTIWLLTISRCILCWRRDRSADLRCLLLPTSSLSQRRCIFICFLSLFTRCWGYTRRLQHRRCSWCLDCICGSCRRYLSHHHLRWFRLLLITITTWGLLLLLCINLLLCLLLLLHLLVGMLFLAFLLQDQLLFVLGVLGSFSIYFFEFIEFFMLLIDNTEFFLSIIDIFIETEVC